MRALCTAVPAGRATSSVQMCSMQQLHDITSKPDAYLGRRSLHIFKAVHSTPLHSTVGEKPQTTQFSW